MFNNKVSNWDKDNFLQSLQSMLEAGNYNYEMIISTQLEFYKVNKKKAMIKALSNIKNNIMEGQKISDALKNSGIITEPEYQVLIKATSLEKGLNRIRNMSKEDNKIYLGFFLLLFPPLILLLVLLISQPYIKDILEQMTKPIIEAGGTPKPLPSYLQDNKIFLMWNAFAFGTVGAYFGLLFFLKKTSPNRFFELMPLFKYKYAKEIFSNIIELTNIGLSISEAIDVLLMKEKDIIKKNIYKDIKNNLINGNNTPISTVIDKYGLGLIIKLIIESNEINKKYKDGIVMALAESNAKYNKFLKYFLKGSFWGGQILMMVVAIKPMVDILLYTSIGQLEFKV